MFSLLPCHMAMAQKRSPWKPQSVLNFPFSNRLWVGRKSAGFPWHHAVAHPRKAVGNDPSAPSRWATWRENKETTEDKDIYKKNMFYLIPWKPHWCVSVNVRRDQQAGKRSCVSSVAARREMSLEPKLWWPCCDMSCLHPPLNFWIIFFLLIK